MYMYISSGIWEGVFSPLRSEFCGLVRRGYSVVACFPLILFLFFGQASLAYYATNITIRNFVDNFVVRKKAGGRGGRRRKMCLISSSEIEKSGKGGAAS